MLPAAPRSPRVLLVEDDNSIRQSLSIFLERERIDVDVAEDGAEALRLLAVRRYEVIVMDLPLQKVSGHELLDSTASDRERHYSDVVVIASADASVRGRLDPSLVARTFAKPVDFAKVAHAVRALCDERSDRRSKESGAVDRT